MLFQGDRGRTTTMSDEKRPFSTEFGVRLISLQRYARRRWRIYHSIENKMGYRCCNYEFKLSWFALAPRRKILENLRFWKMVIFECLGYFDTLVQRPTSFVLDSCTVINSASNDVKNIDLKLPELTEKYDPPKMTFIRNHSLFLGKAHSFARTDEDFVFSDKNWVRLCFTANKSCQIWLHIS